jgi:hypothetical protein
VILQPTVAPSETPVKVIESVPETMLAPADAIDPEQLVALLAATENPAKLVMDILLDEVA